MIEKACAEGNTIPEISDRIVYDANNPDNLDIGQTDGSRDDTLVYSGDVNESRINESTDFIDNGELTLFNKH